MLGMPEDALSELDSLPSKAMNTLESQDLKLAAEMMLEDWVAASATGVLLCKRLPNKGHYFIHTAYAFHALGNTEEAYSALSSSPKSMREDALYHYNMACYSAVLGKVDEAQVLLKKAIEMDDTFGELSKTDPDLENIVITE